MKLLASDMKNHRKSLVRKIISIIVVAAIFYFLLGNLFANYQKLSEHRFEIVYSRLIISFVLLLFVFLFNPLAWMRILNEMKEEMDFQKAFSIFYVSQLGKYVPGKVWTYIGQVYLAEREGIPKERTLISSVLFQLISGVTTVYVFVISLLFWEKLNLALTILAFLCFSVSCLILLRLGLLDWMINLVLNRLLRRKTVVKIGANTVIYAVSVLMLSWMAYGVAYYYFVNSFYPIDVTSSISFTGIYAISWLIGYLSFITPGGLGIREGVQVYLLNLFLPLPISIIISLACRIWLTVGEISVALISLVFVMKRQQMRTTERNIS